MWMLSFVFHHGHALSRCQVRLIIEFAHPSGQTTANPLFNQEPEPVPAPQFTREVSKVPHFPPYRRPPTYSPSGRRREVPVVLAEKKPDVAVVPPERKLPAQPIYRRPPPYTPSGKRKAYD